MKIYLGTDHAGFELKKKVKSHLKELGYQVSDEGAFSLVPDDDYPDFIHIVAKQVASDPENNRGLIFGGSGQGEAIVANRYRGIRAAVYYGGDKEIVLLSRLHNNANILSLGARFVNVAEVMAVIEAWLRTDFSGDERHRRRIDKIDNPSTDNEF